jgi:hypothetical protein|tara:strand:- start:63 stop:344 length:282 start_codon:yes stop_codon:yes gene_type:complete
VSDLATEHSPLTFYNVYRKYILSFTTSKAFTIAIENIAKEKKLTHMDAVLYYCEKEGIEPDSVGSLVSKGLKEKIEANARELNFLPKRAQLPI